MISFAYHRHDGKRRRDGHDSMTDSNNVSNLSKPTELVVALVVATGSHAGVIAEIKEGIYMIGRDRECQIRPKSQSVSERHCLVQHQSSVVRVFDLDSAEGTFVNEQVVTPKTWKLLNHGDQLRCGRYRFEVVIHLKSDAEPESQVEETLDEQEDSNHSRWVATGQHARSHRDAETRRTDAIVNELDGDAIEDDFEFENLDEAQSPSKPSSPQPSAASVETRVPPKLAKQRTPLPKPKITSPRPSRFSGFSWDFGGPDAWKMWVACIAMIATFSYVGWTVYQLQNGSQPKIIRGID